jgi:WD40 repeat protein
VTSAQIGAIVGAIVGLAVGVPTGGVLVWLLGRRPAVEQRGRRRLAWWLPLLVAFGLSAVSLAVWYPAIAAKAQSFSCWTYAAMFNEPRPSSGRHQPAELECFGLTAENIYGRWRWVRGLNGQGWVQEARIQLGDLKPPDERTAPPTKDEVGRFTVNMLAVYSVMFSPDGRQVVAGSASGIEWLQDQRIAQPLPKPITRVVFSPDGHTFLFAFYRSLELWDIATGRKLRDFEGHHDTIIDVVMSADGRMALSASLDGTLRIWDVASGRELRRFEEHTDGVIGVAFSPDGRTALAARPDGGMWLWDVTDGRELRSITVPSEHVTSVAFSPDGHTALSGSREGDVRLWDVASGRELRRFEGHTSRVTSLVFNADGQTFLSGSDDKTVRLWDVASGRELRRFEGHYGGVTSVALSPDGETAASGSWDGTARLWRIR